MNKLSSSDADRLVLVGQTSSAGRRFILLVVVLLLILAVSGFLTSPFLMNNLIRAFLYAAVALTVDVLWGFTGILTFGQSAYFGIGAYAVGLIFTHYGFSNTMAALALVIALFSAWLVGRIISWLSFYKGAQPLYASIVSLVLPIVLVQVIYAGGSWSGSSSGLTGFDSFDIPFGAWYFISGLFLIAVFCATWQFTRSDSGKLPIAIRENAERCEYLGIDVAKVKTRLSTAAALVASAAGFLFASVQMVVAPEYGDFLFGTALVIWVALGGRGTLIGPVLGTLMIDVSSSYLSGDLPYIWQLIIGIVFVIVIVALPQGIMPLFASRFRRTETPSTLNPKIPQLQEVPISARRGDDSKDALVLDNIHKSFGSLQVLSGVTFRARAGELVSIVGPNGAGKTTLMRCISDGDESASGKVLICGEDNRGLPPHVCVELGIGRKFQTAITFDSLTVAESLRIARTRLDSPALWQRSGTLKLPSSTLEILRATGLDKMLAQQCQYLSHGQKQALELAMVLALEPQVVLLDEPTAGLTKAERNLIGDVLLSLTQKYGLCLLLVEHDLDFVRNISSRIVVMHQGKIAMDGSVEEVVNSTIVRNIYAGNSAQLEAAS